VTEELVEVVHTWFGPEDAPLFGALHLPAGRRARAVAVVLPPIGLEGLVAHRALRVLADRLARRGIAALRVDYLGTGDSADVPSAEDQVPGWLRTVGESVEYVRRAGARRVVVVGLRLGATLAASAAAQVDALVLWDPVETGARFLREEALLYRAGVKDGGQPPPDLEGVVGPGTWYSKPTAATLKALSLGSVLADDDGEAPRIRDGIGAVLLATRAEADGGRQAARVAAAAGVDTVTAPGQEALFDWGVMAVPEESVEGIVSWLDRRFGDEDCALDPEVRTSVVVGRAPDGGPVLERILGFGSRGQFGILSSVAGRSSETLVLANAAPPAYHVGPGGMWVEIARAHARRLGPVLRFDGRAEGESRDGGVVSHPSSYTAESIEDAVAALEAARELGAGTLAIGGLGAASWTALRAAALARADAVVAINPGFWQVAPLTQREGAWPGVNVSRVEGSSGTGGPRRAVRRALRTAARAAIPEALWWRLSQRGTVRGPSGVVTPLVRAGTRVHLVLGHVEEPLFDRMRGARLERAVRPGRRLRVTRAPHVDHAILSPAARRAVVEAFVGHLPGQDGHETLCRPVTPTDERNDS